jgi:hypothetical protein
LKHSNVVFKNIWSWVDHNFVSGAVRRPSPKKQKKCNPTRQYGSLSKLPRLGTIRQL